MPAPAWENLDDFLSTDDFATTATFTRENGQVIPGVRVIFDEPGFNAQTGEYDIAALQPRVTCKWGDVSTLKKNDAAVIDGIAYLLDHNPHPDGTGMAVIKLSRDYEAGQ